MRRTPPEGAITRSRRCLPWGRTTAGPGVQSALIRSGEGDADHNFTGEIVSAEMMDL